MDFKRATEIYVPASGKVGSGYIIAQKLVVTALHVVGDLSRKTVAPMQCFVRPLGSWEQGPEQWLAQTAKDGENPPREQGWVTAQLCWPPIGRPIPMYRPTSGKIDLAVLRVTDDQWDTLSIDAPRVGLALAGFEDGFSCEAIGFPQLMMRTPDGRRLRDLQPAERERVFKQGDLIADSFSVKGTIRRDTALKDFQFYVRTEGEMPDDAKLWRGMSGAAVFDDDDRLVGVIGENMSGAYQGALIAEPIATAKDDPTLIDLLNIDGALESLDRAHRSFLSDVKGLANDIYRLSERSFERNLLRPFLTNTVIPRPAEVFVRPEFRRKLRGRLLIRPEDDLTAPRDLEHIVSTQDAVLVIGEPGSGKSFAAADLTRRMAEPWINGRPGFLKDGAVYFPLLLFAQQVNKLRDPAIELGDLLTAAFRATANQGSSIPKDLLDRAYAVQTPVLLIIDAVDEIVGDQNVEKFLDWINSTVKALVGRLKVVLFTRPLGLDPISLEIDQFASFLLLPFDGERQRKLLHRVYKQLGHDEIQSNAKVNELSSLIDEMGMASLLDNPAILTMLAVAPISITTNSALKTRADVIGEYVRHLISTFSSRYEEEFLIFVDKTLLGAPKQVKLDFSRLRQQSQLKILALVGFLSTELDELNSTFFEDVFAKCLSEQLFRDAEELDTNVYGELLRQFALRMGVLIENGNELAFSHNLIREYLAAHYLSAMNASEAQRWLHRWRSPRWRETLQMVLPMWLRRPEGADDLLPRFRAIAASNYDGALFCGETLLENLPLDENEQKKLMEQVFDAIRTWSICANALLDFPQSNPSALVRRLIRRPQFRSKMVTYLHSLQEGYCPFTGEEFVRLLSELDEEGVLRDLAETGTPFIRANAARALLDSGHSERAIPAALSVLKDTDSSIPLCRRVIDALVEAGEHRTLIQIAIDWEIPTPVRVHSAAHLWQMTADHQSRDALIAAFFGTAHERDLDAMVVDSLFRSEVFWARAEKDEISPITLMYAAAKYLTDPKIVRAADVIARARNLLVKLVSDPTNGMTALPVADLIEPVVGRGAIVDLLQREFAPLGLRERLVYAKALAQRGDFALAAELAEQTQDESCRDEARKILADEVDHHKNKQTASETGSSGYTSAEVLDAKVHAYEAHPTPETLRDMLDSEIDDTRQAKPRDRAADLVNRALFTTGRADILRARLADAGVSSEGRGSALTMLANLGDAESIVPILSDSSVSGEVRRYLPEALESLGLQEELPRIRSSIILDPGIDPNTRKFKFRPLLREDNALAERVAITIADDQSQPRAVRWWPLIYLTVERGLGIDRLVAFAAEEPTSCGALIYDLVDLRAFCSGAVLAVVRATAPTPIPYLSPHVLDRLVPEQPSKDEVALIIELLERVEISVGSGTGALFDRLTDLLDRNAIELDHDQRQKLRKITRNALADTGASAAVNAAVFYWRISELQSWIDEIVATVDVTPTQYGVLARGLSLPISARGMLADRLAASQVASVRALSAIQLCAAERIDDARTVVRSFSSSNGEAVDLAVFTSEFVETVVRVGCEKEIADTIAFALITALTNGPVYPSPDLWAIFTIVLQHASPTRRNTVSEAILAATGTIGGMMKLLWEASVAECKADYYGALRAIWALCVRLPDQSWVRQTVRALALKAGKMDWIIQLLEDEYSFLRGRKDFGAARTTLEELRPFVTGTTQ